MNTKDKAPVTLILNGVTLSNASSAPIYIMDAEEAVIILADGSKNRIGREVVRLCESDRG